MTVHNARAWDWLEAAHGSDKTGPLKGVPYDGALTKADGKGQWWEGLDPADLYGPHGAARTPEARKAYELKWFNRTKDLVDKYRPDLLYFDDIWLPLGEAGTNIAAHYYNANLQWHDGKQEAVLNRKRAEADAARPSCWTSNVARETPWMNNLGRLTPALETGTTSEISVTRARGGCRHLGGHRQQERQSPAEYSPAWRRND